MWILSLQDTIYTNGTVGKTRVVQAVSQGKAYADVRGTLDTDTNDFVATPEAKVIAVAPGVWCQNWKC